MTSLELREQRAALVADSRKLIDIAEGENREMSAEEEAEWYKRMADADEMEKQIRKAERGELLVQAEALSREVQPRRTSPQASRQQTQEGDHEDALRAWLLRGAGVPLSYDAIENASRCGIDVMSNRVIIRTAPPKRSMVADRAMTTTGVGTGKEYVSPNLWTEVDKALKAFGSARNVVTVLSTPNGIPLPFPTINDTTQRAVIVSEASDMSGGTDVATGSVTLGAFKYASKTILVSVELLQDSQLPLEPLLGEAIGTRFARGYNADITVGAGTTAPFGLVTRASDSGVVAGGTAAAPTWGTTGDSLLDVLHSVDRAYRDAPGFGWMMHDSTLKTLRKIKDTTGAYAWQVSTAAGEPDVLFGKPVYVNNDMPVSPTVSAKAILVGDFKKYKFREVQQMELYRLDQLYLEHGQIGFLAFARADGNLINTSAVSYAKLAAA